jgi:transcriptional regulator with XRE-family HTH domain
MFELDYESVAAQFLRALRAHRSQVQWSRWLGYKSNVAYTWESGRRWPTAAETMRAAGRAGIDVRAALTRFYGREPPWLADHAPESAEGVASLMRDLKGQLSTVELAARVGASRYAVARWLNASTQPRLPDFFAVIEGASVRLVDFVTVFVSPESVPAVQPLFERQDARRRLAFEAPWTQAVLRVLDLAAYKALDRHDDAWVAGRLGIATEEVTTCFELMLAAGQVRREGRRYVIETMAVDTRRTPEIGRHLKAHWTEVAAERIRVGAPGQFSYNVFSVSRADFERIRKLHLDYFHALRAIVAESEPEECVAIANVQLFALDE